MPKTPDQAVYYDGLFSLELGMDSNTPPLILPRNKASFMSNGTVRKNFLTHRPAVRKMTMNFGEDAALQAAVESGLFQGGCFYNPDFGAQCLMGAISGHLYQFSISDNVATVSDVSIPGNPNPPTAQQAWLWQSENYIIWNDGLSLPVFYDGNSSRRSYGDQQVLNTFTNAWTAPPIGDPVTITLDAPWTGPMNVPVIINDTVNAFYQTVATGSGVYNVELTNISGTPGTVIASGDVVSRPNVFGTIQAFVQPPGTGTFPPSTIPGQNGKTLQLKTYLNAPGGVGTQIQIRNDLWTVFQFNGYAVPYPFWAANNTSVTLPLPYQIGEVVYLAFNNQPNNVVGTLTAPVTIPALGGTVTVQLTAPYLGTDNQPVFIGDVQFTIKAVPSPPGGMTLTLINLDDTPGTVHPTGANPPPIDILSVPELPTGRMGAYGMGRNWVSLTDGKSFIASDIVGGSSGTKANKFRDAPLKITENTFLFGGGVFQVPGSVGDIRAMRFAATLDASLGQGPIQIFTPTVVFSCNAPVDRTTWQSITNPILTESLIGNGAQGQNSTVPANNDTFFRSVDGIRSLILARREFNTWGNVPLSIEVERVLRQDNTSLLNYGSAIVFDNRLIMTAMPTASAGGVYHPAAVVLNFDPLSGVEEKTNALWDGLWDGLNVLQYISGLVNGVERAFAFTYNTNDNKIELYEILTDEESHFDNDTIPIVWGMESCSLFKEIKGKGPFDLIRLVDGELYVDDVVGLVTFQTYYKPDQYPCWVPWFNWSICAKKANPASPQPSDILLQPQYRYRMGFGIPSPDNCDPVNNFPLREGSTFQWKLTVTGHCRFLGAKFMAMALPDVLFAKPVCEIPC